MISQPRKLRRYRRLPLSNIMLRTGAADLSMLSQPVRDFGPAAFTLTLSAPIKVDNQHTTFILYEPSQYVSHTAESCAVSERVCEAPYQSTCK